jgi:hypothetical protein
MTADSFTRDMFTWLNQVNADPELPGSAVKVALAIAQHINRQTGEAWPSHPMIASEISMSPDTVKDMVGRLRQAGHLAVEVGRGLGHSSRYRLILKKGEPSPPLNREASPPLKGEPSPPIDDRKGGVGSAKGGAGSQKRGSRPPANHLIEPSDEPSEGDISPDVDHDQDRRRHQQEIDTAFEQFYGQYPKHVAKAAALKTYRGVIAKKLATPAELLAGALRYAGERSGQDPWFTKHPATWLNGGCWADEPAQPIGNTIDEHGNPVPVQDRPPDRRQPANAHAARAQMYIERLKARANDGGGQ